MLAVIFMLPSLQIGLFGDDLIQRLVQYPPEKLPSQSLRTGFVPNDSGKLSTVVNDLFGYIRDEDSLRLTKTYGLAPWWTPDNIRIYLWRPLTAFTHWLDYRLYPDSPALMHAQNIAWFAMAVYLVAALYRRMAAPAGLAVAGVAAVLWLLDKDSFGPVAYVANRGFFIALVFGLLCWHAHVLWRTTNSPAWMWLAVSCLALSPLANEGGASTLAFLIAYALVMEPRQKDREQAQETTMQKMKRCLLSLSPYVVIVVLWRIVYVANGYGVRNFSGYIDPGYSPLSFLQQVVSRVNQVLGGN